ncbi:ABC transporter substrate-binding protein [Paenibacillus sp. MMS20-IR301]|uniref:ABC transporter substrate-binding protein n=1 Tax=Paenibacillus sp. MMS20-IR301 TaxID=2895946 RepID=UPI0028EB7BD6|nr:ABC transporter substrate-binding protein [Paenibacillus sp. MMS20-IR301]WNS45657.1 ABC transporter substrate-binding protein [Paenibacillus sp. MMS20-IR301]
MNSPVISGKKAWLPYILLLSVLLVLPGCSGNTPPAASGSTAPEAGPPRKLTLMLDWYPNAVHSFLYAAQSQGYFAEEGLEVEIRMPADSNDALKLVAAGQVDLALSYQPQVLMARGEQIPVKSVAALVRHPLNHLMVATGSGITRPKELAGRQAGYSSIPLYEAMLNTMVKHDGGDPSSLKLVDVGFELVPALSTGRVDGIMGGFINHEQLILEQEGDPVRSFNPVDYGVPDYYELVLVASEQGLQDSQGYFQSFVNAMRKGQQFVQAQPEQALKLLLAHQDDTAPLDPAIEQRSLEILLPLMDSGSLPFGHQDTSSWENVRKWLSDNGLLAADVDSADAFINF